jgi:phosphoribosylglycinamide formyltransferase-1
MRIAALASHGGSVLQAVIDAIESGELAVELTLVISNNSQSGALQRASKHQIETRHLSSKTHPDEAALDGEIEAALLDSQAEWVLLTGYMKKLGPRTLGRFRNRILNTHPALLPKFGGEGFFGRKIHAAVLQAGESETGATVHLVDADYDTGPILAQVRVPVKAADTEESLEGRVQSAERKLIVTTLAELAARKEASNY